MKKIIILFLTCTTVFAQGKLASDFKNLIGKKYTNERQISSLKLFKYEQGIIIGNPNEGIYFSKIDVYRKGNVAIILLSKKINKDTNEFAIIDVLKINNIPKNTEIRTSNCSRNDGYPEETIIAIVVSNNKNKNTITKQAFALQDIRFVKIPIKGIKCLNDEMN
ncbi:hypothetical protein OX283_013865 [Flavobacterium sp. SUN052]|uniref:hypothetical protein n=1 Tax=Flavobacterium sp. SUN052 TaxID=3002441 RepID=UPI00237EC1E5|nr:hypothetical protein [Flavobacterium sp. SUN052]MEC4005753.1 hypothetical protein [Flavobacterium sp. SUN052]